MIDYSTAGFFVLRTPLLPLEEFLGLSQGLRAPEALQSNGDLAEAYASDRKLVRSRLKEFVARPEIKEALWIASPEFFESLATWHDKPESEKGQKLEQSLYRYVARMISRSTPFGLFAACATGEIGSETKLELGPRHTYWRRSRLDMEYLYNLAEKVASDPALRKHLRFRPNTSLYLAGGRYHHAQSYFQNDDKMRLYRLVATEPTPYLDATLQRASTGATPNALAQALVKDEPDIALEEAEYYVGQLIESQLLAAELIPPITGPEPIEDMLEQLQQAELTSLIGPLTSIASNLKDIDSQSIGVDLSSYKKIVETISQLPAEFKVEHLIQVDAMKPAPQASLDQRLISDVLRGIETLYSILPAFEPESLKDFREQFQERYEAQEVPLFQVLDEEVGIGFERRDNTGALAEPLLEGIDIAPQSEEEEVRSRKPDFILLRKLGELLREGKAVLSLDKKLIDDLRVKDPRPLPDAFAVMGSVLAPSEPGKRHSFHFHNLSGPSGANLLGRFCHAHDRLNDHVKEYLRAEERLNDRALFAEIAHLPEGRIGNVLFRPILREYEIPYLATSRMPPEKQLPVSDLLVSVQGGRIVLRSNRLGREVLPRMTTAHGYTNPRNLKLYKFLCMLQLQGVTHGLSWNWGVLDQAAFVPRVVSANVIFSLARWKVTKEVIDQLSKLQGAERLRAVAQWREKNRVPRYVYLTEHDNQLLIDFDNALSVEVMVDYLKKRPSAKLVELLHDPANLCVRGPEGTFANEVVIPFVRNAATSKPTKESANGPQAAAMEGPAPSAPGGAQQVAAESDLPMAKPLALIVVPVHQRSFLPGSEWLYAKIYASPSHMDRLLLQSVRPLAQKILSSGAADHWFFIRYSDPHLHLRLRFHGDPQRLSRDVLPQLWEFTNSEIQRGTLWRVQLDTYEREIERYGGLAGIQIAERFFHLDSELVLELLSAIRLSGSASIRWQAACYTVDRLLSGLGFNTQGLNTNEKREIVNRQGKYYEKNFSIDQRYKKQISDKFRNERATLEKIITGQEELEIFPPEVHRAVASYTEQLKTIRAELEEKRATGELTQPIADLAASYVHMHLNRLFRSAQNAQEMVLYDFLARTYDSKLAKEKGKQQQ